MSVPTATLRSETRLWLTAILLSLGVNVGGVLVLGLLVIHSLIFVIPEEDVTAQPVEEERLITIVPLIIAVLRNAR